MAGEFGIVILAAGESRRMGRPKQLMPYAGSTLVGHAVASAQHSGAAEVVVVVGAYASEVRHSVEGLRVVVAENARWREGMGRSIACGVRALSSDVAVIALVDQPLVPASHLRELAELVFAGAPAAATTYEGVLGAPCAFAKSEFPRLMALDCEVGARMLIRATPDIAALPLDAAALDIDTPDDYGRLTTGHD